MIRLGFIRGNSHQPYFHIFFPAGGYKSRGIWGSFIPVIAGMDGEICVDAIPDGNASSQREQPGGKRG